MPDKERIFHIPESLEKQEKKKKKGVNQNYDKSLIYLPRQSIKREIDLIFSQFAYSQKE